MRKKDETLRDTLLSFAREIVSTQGPDALNIRTLSKRVGVASGTVYNYFASKDEILLVLTEEYWQQTLLDMRGEIYADRFTDQISEIYFFLKRRVGESAGVLMNSLSNVESAGRERMQSMQGVLRSAIIEQMRTDAEIKQSIWDDKLTQERFADFIIMNMMLLLRMNAPHIDSFVEIITRIVYKGA